MQLFLQSLSVNSSRKMRQEKQLKRSVCGDKCDEERNLKDVIRKYKWKLNRLSSANSWRSPLKIKDSPNTLIVG